MKLKFGTGGYRAIMGEGFTKEVVQTIAQAMSNIMHQKNFKKEIFVGYDNRFMSEHYAQWISEVFAGNNIKVTLMDKASITPISMFYAKHNNLDYSVVVTASHNPFTYNGIKVHVKGGKDASIEETKEIENEVEKINATDIKTLAYEQALNCGLITYTNQDDNYLDSLFKLFPITNAPKIAFDVMFGASIPIVNNLIKRINFEKVSILHNERNPLFAMSMPSPTPSTTQKLKQLVLDENYDLGFAIDGDGDRLSIIDKYGNFIDNSYLMAVVYYFMVIYKNLKGDIVKNTSTSIILDKLANKFGFKCHTVPVGFKHVSSKLIETNALLAGEGSGSMASLNHVLGKDAIFAILAVLEVLSVTKKPLHELIIEVKEFAEFNLVYGEKQYSYNDNQKSYIMDTIFNKKLLPNFNKPVATVEYKEDAKIIFDDNCWILIRFSGTEATLRICMEGQNSQEVETNYKLLEEFLKIK